MMAMQVETLTPEHRKLYSMLVQDRGYTETQRHRDTDTQRQRHRIQDQANASQPGGPSKEGPADIYIRFFALHIWAKEAEHPRLLESGPPPRRGWIRENN